MSGWLIILGLGLVSIVAQFAKNPDDGNSLGWLAGEVTRWVFILVASGSLLNHMWS
jgi:hypothetical protein